MDRLTAAEVFVSIASRGSLTGAADALGMSRPMVSRYLAEMEQWAGARLLHRTTRRVSLTPAGEEALARCQRLLEVATSMPATSAAGEDVPRGLLRIASSQSLAQEVLATAVADYLRRWPQVAIDLHIDARAVNLVEDRIDLAIRITDDIDPNLIARRLGQCESVVCASPAWVAAHGMPQRAEDLAIHNCLTYSYFGKSLWEFDHAGQRIAVPVGGNLSANETHVLLAAALQGAGIVQQPQYSVAPLIAQGRLVVLLPDYRPRAMGVHGIYTSRRQMSTALRTLIDFLAEWFARPDWWISGEPLSG
ncbi:LysR family transcriptional regulator [Roseateles sp. YR242]|uniref:LysR family transcriptional regulator n=1 Tax=Roseateles sp. YR242 TaxID=1855305 RepID=UPI000B807313|nr:LysR family transcriptional regulator [Roseateles sp. YR242]